MRFDDLTLRDPEGELRLRFHAEFTVISGLGEAERDSIAAGIVDSVVGMDPAVARSLMVLSDQDLTADRNSTRENEPAELCEARVRLAAITAELDRALGHQHAVEGLRSELNDLDRQLRIARDGAARRTYAQALAQLERVRAEVAAVQASAEGVESDRHLLERADDARSFAAAWSEAQARAESLSERLEGSAALDPAEVERRSSIPESAPAELDSLIDAVHQAASERRDLEERIQALSVSGAPTPSDPAVAELGVRDQAPLWEAADRLSAALAAEATLQVSAGLVASDTAASDAIGDIEAAHTRVEEAQRRSVQRAPWGIGAIAACLIALLVGFVSAPVVIPLALVGGVVAGVVAFMVPRWQAAAAARAEAAALLRVGAATYLGFHLRRVDASFDPDVRLQSATILAESSAARARWVALVGQDISVELAQRLRTEIDAYHLTVEREADGPGAIEEIRRQIAETAEPAIAAARRSLLQSVEPFLLDETALEDLDALPALVSAQCQHGEEARLQADLDTAGVDVEKISGQLGDLLVELGFETGPLDARMGAFEWAVSRATERERARTQARPSAQIDAELAALERTAEELRRPEWDSAIGVEAHGPAIPDLEARRGELMAKISAARDEVDVDQLVGEKAAAERRVASLQTQAAAQGAADDPLAISEVKQQLLTRLTAASVAGPDGEPVPVILNEVLHRVPADRKWDLLDLLRAQAASHQLVYLTNDEFIAAWAHQRALDGTITLLELSTEPVS